MGVRRALIILCVAVMFGCATTKGPGPLEPSRKARTYYERGVSLSKDERYQEALSAFKKAVSLYPDYGNAYYNMGIIYHDLDRAERAIQAYRKAIEINPKDAAAHMNLGNIYLRQGQLSVAILELEEAVKIDPGYGLAHHNLILAYYLARMYHRSWDHLNQMELLGISPDPDLRDAVAAALHLEEGTMEENQ